MRILIVTPDYPNTLNPNTHGFIHSRAKIYKNVGNHVKVFVPSGRQTLLTYNYEDINVIKASLGQLISVVNDFNPDVITVHKPKGAWCSSLMKVDRPIVSWIHGAEALFTALHHYHFPLSVRDSVLKGISLIIDPIKLGLLRRFLLLSTAVVYVSQWMKTMTEKYALVKHPSSFVIPNPIDVDLFRPLNFDLLEKLNRGVSVRGLGWKYGIDIAIRAYSNLKETGLTIVGSGSLEKYLRKLAVICKSNVKFIAKGFPHERLPTLYGEFGYFVAPSRTEAQGVAMCEGMACGLPVVATNVGGIPEFVKDRFNGLLVSPEDPLELRKAITLLISDRELYVNMSNNAIRFVKDNLSHPKIYQKEYEIFKQAQEIR
ncbi:glycosyltransferase [Candidatus Bathyarchaeota archaeon]|nr:MAG: glycosyltransferase [Candidatus Bathyarchaeota archaeon]